MENNQDKIDEVTNYMMPDFYKQLKPIKRCGRFKQLVMQNRIGKFRISDPLIEQGLANIMDKLLAKVFIVKAEHISQQMEYIGYHELFEAQQEGSMPIEYEFVFEKQENGTAKLKEVKKLNAVSA